MKKIAMIAMAAAILAGCGKEATLNSSLEERQANLVMAALLDEGIQCRKVEGEEGTWNVMIDEKDFARAANLLERQGLPQRKFDGVSETFKKTGMVSSPSEERIRFMNALAQDLSSTITMIDGVVDARVHVVLPNNDPFAKKTLPSSAAVAIRARWDADLSNIDPASRASSRTRSRGCSTKRYP